MRTRRSARGVSPASARASRATASSSAPRASWAGTSGTARAGIAWLAACRPKSLTAAVVPFLVGSALAIAGGATPRWAHAACALVGYLLIQIGTNLVNDACDFTRGADTKERAGPVRVTQAGVFAPRTVHAAGVACFLLAGVAMIPPLLLRGAPLAALLVASCAAGYFYTGGPYPYGYRGLGDLAVFLFFGFVATGGVRHVHRGGDDWKDGAWMDGDAAIASAQVGCLAAALIAINNLRDARTDAEVGKRTLPVVFGETFGRWEITALVCAPFALNAYWAATRRDADDARAGSFSRAAALTSATAPFAAHVARRAWTYDVASPEFNRVMSVAAALHLAFGALLAVGVVLDAGVEPCELMNRRVEPFES